MAPEQTTPTALLRSEHDLILAVLEGISTMTDTAPDALDQQTARRCVTFLQLFADACHHGKEEDLLFPALTAHGLPQDGGPIAVMLHEHELGRSLVQAMADEVEQIGTPGSGAAERFSKAAVDFVDLLTAHIAKENDILFNIADQLIQGDALGDLLDGYATKSEERFEGRSRDELVELGRQIISGD